MEGLATSVAPGSVIANTYRLERVLGEGGMGIVYEASHLRLPKRVAIKLLHAKPDADQLARFRQEAEAASRIGHPGIVDILDFDTLPSGVPFLVMEMLAGESLGARLAQGAMPPARAIAILRQ